MALGLELFRRTANLSESEPRMLSNWSWSKGGQNFSVPLHDNDRQYRTVTTGLARVQPDRCPLGMARYYNDDFNQALKWLKMPDDAPCFSVNGCTLSQGANRTYRLDAGEYFLETMMSSVLGQCSDFHAKMVCSGGAETAMPADSEPVGFSVDADTGAITGTPQRVRDGYTMRLRAVDAAEVRTDIAEWTFGVAKAPAFSLNSSTGWSAEVDGGLASKYHVGEPYILPRPSLGTAELLQYPAGDRLDLVVYLLSVDAADSEVDCTAGDADGARAISALTDVSTGEGAINVQCTGNYNAKLVVRDGGGAEVTVRSWNFTVRRRDTDVAEYGPNGRSCANGVAEDGADMDGAFTCNCGGTRFTGENCEAASEPDGVTAAVAGAVLGVLVLACVAIFLLLRWQRHTRSMMATDFLEQLQAMKERGEVDEALALKGGVPRELKRGWLALIDTLGKGAFGEVWKGLLQDAGNSNIPAYLVACKVVKEASGSLDSAGVAAAEEELLKEALLMAQVEAHPHLVSLVGVITRGAPKVLVLSFCEHGELQGALKKRAADGDAFSDAAKCNFCKEVADGMAHLALHNFVHRDLAARNVLLGSGMFCKVADFGLSRRVQTEDNTGDYYRSSSGIIPVRWTAPEGISSQKFSSASDVWSYGITCVEIFQDGALPYPGVKSNPEVIKLVCTQGLVHARPKSCTERVYSELLRCWSYDPDRRPDFGSLKDFFLGVATRSASGDTASSRGMLARAGDSAGLGPGVAASSTGQVYDLGFQEAGAGGGAAGQYNLGYQEDPGGRGAGDRYNLGYRDADASTAGENYDLGHHMPAAVPLQIIQPPVASTNTDARASGSKTPHRSANKGGTDGGAALLQLVDGSDTLANTTM